MNNNLKPIETLKPFTRFLCTIGELPTSYLISMTYEEQLLWFCNYLEKTVIPTIDNNAEAVIELQTFISNYFNNLDVQEEINNKLDEMVEDGTLETILNNYTQVEKVYDTVADLKEDTTIVEGMKARTLGYYEINDGGGSQYIIKTSSDTYYETLSNDLVGELVITKTPNLAQYGVSPDNLDNSTQLNNAFTYNKVLDGFNGVVNVTEPLIIEHNEINYDFKGLTINVTSNSTIEELISIYSNDENRIKGSFKNLNIISNGKVEESLCIYDTRNTYFENINVTGSTVAEISLKGSKNSTGCTVTIRDVRCENGRKDNLMVCANSIALKIASNLHDSFFDNIVTYEYKVHIENHGFNWFNKIHSWNYYYVLGSVMFNNYGSCTLDNIMCDTIETFMIFNDSVNVLINNSRILYNTSAELTGVTPKPFILSSTFTTNYGRLRITSSHFHNYGGGGNDLVVLPEGVNDVSLNMVNISNTYTSTYKVIPHCFDFYQKNLTLDFNNYSVIYHGDNTETMKKYISVRGLSIFKFQFYSNSLTITAKTWTPLCKITDTLLIDRSKAMIGFILNASTCEMYPITWRINSSNEIELRVQSSLPEFSSFTIYLEDSTCVAQLANN